MNQEKTILALLRSMPSLAYLMTADGWDAVRFDRHVATTSLSHGERCAAQFILAVWNPDHPWESGKFDVMESLRTWDENHHRAFLAWAADPWWA